MYKFYNIGPCCQAVGGWMRTLDLTIHSRELNHCVNPVAKLGIDKK